MNREDKLAQTQVLSGKYGWAVFSPEPSGGNGPAWAGPAQPQYRYLLGRTAFGAAGFGRIGFVMLNPSTASHEIDDPTIRKCVGFARRWRAAEIIVANCYAFRATNPKVLRFAAEPVGPLNKQALLSLTNTCKYVVCAWGRHARVRGVETARLFAEHNADLRCLGINKDGSPKHPLYVAYNDAADGPPKFNPYAEVEIRR